MARKAHTIDLITLGCSKNLVDSERLMYRMQALGYKCSHDPAVPQAPIAVINTCGFIGDAKEESIQTILAFAQRKNKGAQYPLKKLYVMGCLSERYAHNLPQELPEVDGWFGKFDYMNLLEQLPSVQTSDCSTLSGTERTLTTPSHYAYLKISEGCNRMCSYCAIPLITGHHRSRPMEEILTEARWLQKQGVKELNVIAQDLSSYGLDLYHEHRLPQLVDRLADIDGIEWIRLHYTYPTDFPNELLEVMARRSNVCKYLDIALQHCTDRMLSLMRRHITRQEQDALLERIRRTVPGITLRTTLMVGHPGETEADFEELLQWVRTMRFERMGAFTYSEEEGTYAQRHYTDDIPPQVKQQRLEQLMAVQQQIAEEMAVQKVGQTMKVVIDREENDYFVGRTEYDSPEVDCEVLIKKSDTTSCLIGSFYTVRIEQADTFDLYATII